MSLENMSGILKILMDIFLNEVMENGLLKFCGYFLKVSEF